MLVLYVLLVIVLQSVVFARLNIFGVSPDLILVSVISFAILEKSERATLFAAGSGFMQDVLSFGAYLHTITRVAVSALVGILKEGFLGNEYSMAALFVAFFTPLILIIEGGLHAFFGGRQLDLMHLASTIFVATLYNLILVPIIFPILKKLCHA